MKPSNPFEWFVSLLVMIGSINWGLVAAAHFNLVTFLFGDGSMLTRVVYGLVGLAGAIMLINTLKCCSSD